MTLPPSQPSAFLSSLRPRRRPPTPAILRPSPPFPSPQSLSDFLLPLLPPGALSSWGPSPGSKTLHNLFIELSHGETSLSLTSNSLLRSLHVTVLNIRNRRGQILVESHQILSDGSARPRGRPLSEKMRPGETVEAAAVRAVAEELGIGGSGSVRIVPGSYSVRVEEKASASYPGLPARYVLHCIDALVEGLPEEGEFSTEEMGEGGEGVSVGSAVFVKRHFWKWIEDSDR